MSLLKSINKYVQIPYGYNGVIHVSEEGIAVEWTQQSRFIKWDQIIGYNESYFMTYLGWPRNYPSYIMLDNYEMVDLPIYYQLDGSLADGYSLDENNKYSYIDAFTKLINANAFRLNRSLNEWYVWRELTPSVLAIFGAFGLLYSDYYYTFYVTHYIPATSAIIASIVAAHFIGNKWELSARIKYWTPGDKHAQSR